jgi:hypothetical protein
MAERTPLQKQRGSLCSEMEPLAAAGSTAHLRRRRVKGKFSTDAPALKSLSRGGLVIHVRPPHRANMNGAG